ncbi:MAG: Unknown protein [uncultured Aureispira sp.]|uniref:STAS/SEC14 domain-containing protein n=1 Tax=uncultured Aureispira sp. TaxID=1331704 RepID=A0A6S6T234_9BACT|nr:MAG: Unknown protein [uncultured Aureispira sp.]
MERKTTESIFFFRAENILETKPNPTFEGENTLEGAKENLAIMNEFLHKNTLPKGLLSNLPSRYTKKEVLNYYHEHLNTEDLTIYSAFIAGSFATKFVLGILLKISDRFVKKNTTTKVFNNREEAFEWLQESLSA